MDLTQVLVDGISKSALEAAVELVYTGAHLVGRHGVSVEEVVEAGVALGLPFSAENIYTDSERTIFEVTPVEPSLHLRPLEHSSGVCKALEPQSHSSLKCETAWESVCVGQNCMQNLWWPCGVSKMLH